MQDATEGDGKQLVWSTVLMGFGIMAGIDEIVFHQLLQWHHFYDRSTSDVGLLSDGLLHGAELVIIVAGFFLFRDVLSQHPINQVRAWGGFFLGAGGFQVFDGIVDHKILNLHEIRYNVETLPYDLIWNGFGVLLIIAGLVLLRRTADRGTSRPTALRSV